MPSWCKQPAETAAVNVDRSDYYGEGGSIWFDWRRSLIDRRIDSPDWTNELGGVGAVAVELIDRINNNLLLSSDSQQRELNGCRFPPNPTNLNAMATPNASTTGALMNGCVEERVQVDRRKLEQMIIADGQREMDIGDRPPFKADMFFRRVMEETNTLISWPTKLKIGAKTKKDPYVKIVGQPPEVERAKKCILDILETRHNRVTIKIDVAFTDHSHIIGKQGRNTQLAMKETGCHIHFPDSNRNPDLEKSNQVSIAGPMQTADKARRNIRALAPLVITLELKQVFDDPASVVDDPILRELSSGTGISVLARTNRSSGMPFFVVRGSVYQENTIKSAVLRLQRHFMKTTKAVCSTALDVLQPQQSVVLGPHNVNIQLISERTNAQIHYPRGDVAGATTFFIQGSIDAVLNARRHLVGCLPMCFIFELHGNAKLLDVEELEKKHNLSITLRQKKNESNRNVIIKGQERQASQMYAIRQRLMDDCKEETVIATDFEFMKDFDPSALLQNCESSLITANLNAAMPMVSPMTPYFIPTPGYFPMTSPFPNVIGQMLQPQSAQSVNSFFNFTYSDNSSMNEVGTPTTTTQSEENSPDGSGFTSLRSSPTVDNAKRLDSQASKTDSSTSLNDPLPGEAPLASGLLEAAKKIQQITHNDWKAPGAERLRQIQGDYDKQKVMATKAMHERPAGVRIPNDCWSGFGFSRSMPADMARQRFAANRGSFEDNASTALQQVDEEDEDKIGPWPLENDVVREESTKGFHSTTYFDPSSLPKNSRRLLDTDDIVTLLSNLNLTKYVDLFVEEEIDMTAFLTMDDQALKDLGVNTFGARRKLLVTISEIRMKEGHAANRTDR